MFSFLETNLITTQTYDSDNNLLIFVQEAYDTFTWLPSKSDLTRNHSIVGSHVSIETHVWPSQKMLGLLPNLFFGALPGPSDKLSTVIRVLFVIWERKTLKQAYIIISSTRHGCGRWKMNDFYQQTKWITAYTRKMQEKWNCSKLFKIV